MGGRGSSSGGVPNIGDPDETYKTSSESLRRKLSAADSQDEKDDIVEEWIEGNQSTDTETIIDPATGNEYDCYKVVIDGIVIYFTELDQAEVAAIRELIDGGVIPPILKEGIDSIIIIPDSKPGSPTTVAQENDGVITIFENRDVDAGVIAHEASHTLAMSRWGSVTPPAGSDYAAAISSGEPPVSRYAGTHPSEDFAEAVRMYVENPDLLKDIAPRRYRVIRRMMMNRRYHG